MDFHENEDTQWLDRKYDISLYDGIPHGRVGITEYERMIDYILSLQYQESNQPPVLSPIGNKSVNLGQLLEFDISATDADEDILTYSVSNLPDGATFNAQTLTLF